MSRRDAGESLEKYLSHRRFWLEVVLGAVALGCLVNFFAGAAQDSLKNYWPDGPWGLGWTLFFGSGLLIIVGAILFYLLRRDVVETSGLTMVLPLWVDTLQSKVEILPQSRYFPANYGRQIVSQVIQPFAMEFAINWPGQNPLQGKEFQSGHFCWERLRDLVEAIFVKFLHEYGEHTLSKNAPYHGEFRRLVAAGLKSVQLPRDQWPDAWQKNIFLQTGGPQSLRLPRQAEISHNHTAFIAEEPPGRLNLTLKTSLAGLTISIAPFWTILRNRQRAEEVFAATHAAKATFLVIPLELRLVLKGKVFVFKKHKAEYLWFQKLMENARRRLSYGYFLKQPGEA